MDSDSDWSDPNSRDHDLPSNSASPLVPSTLYKSDHVLPWDKTYHLLRGPTAHRFPVELFSEIFLYTVHDDRHSQTNLMLVCRHWYDIMLSTPGIHSQLRIYSWTEKKDVERFGRRWLLDVTVDTQDVTDVYKLDEPVFNPVKFYACFMAASEAASRWRSLVLISLPPPGEYKDLTLLHPFQSLESFKLAASCKLGNLLEPLITAITTNVTSRFTVLEVLHPDAALHIVQPAHFQIFSSLTTLRLICRRMQNPVDIDILPSLHKVEIFEAHHLSLPISPPDVDLLLTQTLHILHLKSVSVQWMAGRVFPALEECSIIFIHHVDALQSVYMPSCSILKYDSNNLRTLEHFHHPPLATLEVKCGQWRTWRGNLQLATLHHIFAAQSLTCLHLEIKCSEWLLAYMLGLSPALEELRVGLSSPYALSSAFFLAIAAGGRNSSAVPPSGTITPLCRQLRKLHLHYKRWSRGVEKIGLIPGFGAIVASHPPEEQNFSFRLSFGEGLESQEWTIHEPVKRFDDEWLPDEELDEGDTFIGVSSPHGIVPLSRAPVYVDGPLTGLQYPPLPRESEYIVSYECLEVPIDYFFSFHGLKEVRIYNLFLKFGSNTPFSPNTPLFHTLKVLGTGYTQSSPFAGQTFHKLERCRGGFGDCPYDPGQGPLTEMPLCTRLETSLPSLATLKLPQIRELSVWGCSEEHGYFWGGQIAVNTNLSGLKLLHLRALYPDWSSFTGIIEMLELLQALETLVLITDKVNQHPPALSVPFFRALLPMHGRGTSRLNRSNWVGQIFGVLCPRLESLKIEGFRPTDQPELMPVLKDIVTQRAMIGSPLKSFTF